ncbi:SDR family oxidoreductase [Ruminococcaceae bacterium OttesenSCG-928-D13]|nr:SDR family oxidoreductase [Ruminococcaceae bacterium OttesenSCG-928-D13]
MADYVITGATSGIGLATRQTLEKQGHTVYNIDYKDGDFTADLSRPEGRLAAVDAVKKAFPEGIDGFISNAGVGPLASAKMIFALNYFAGVQLAEGLRPLLAKKKGNCVFTASNTVSQPSVRPDWVDMLTNTMDEERSLEIAADIPPELGAFAYASSKHALARWVRRVSGAWATEGMRVNAVDPGNTTTPMTQSMSPEQMDMALLIPIPTRYGTRTFLDAQEIANGIVFLASPQASGINGIILFVDGGIDALLRSERF